MPNCNLMSWVTLTVVCIQVIITDVDVLVNYSGIVSRRVLIVLSVTKVSRWRLQRFALAWCEQLIEQAE